MNPAKHGLATSLGATWVAPEQIHRQDVDLFVPAGVGGMLTSKVIDELRCSAVVGPANNQFDERSGAEQLHSRAILWAPDFVVNAGGVIYVALTAEGRDGHEVEGKIAGIGNALKTIYAEANRVGGTTLRAAEGLAFSRLDRARSEPVLVSG
jgi:leucine dehydrogenase